MATVTEIAQAIADTLETLSWVDAAAIDTFYPAVEGVACVALVVPFEQEASSAPVDIMGSLHRVTMRIPVEFWIKHISGNQAETMQRGRDAGTLAMIGLLQNDGDGYNLSADIGFEERVDGLVQHGNVNWLRVSLMVPIENEVSI
jgi:hypothetical protein